MSKPLELTPARGLIFRITHIDNVPWLLEHGVHCRASDVVDPNFRAIGHVDLIDRRRTHPVPTAPGGTLSDYVPFYFTPASIMLYNIGTGFGVPRVSMRDIVILVSSLPKLRDLGQTFLFTDRHALLATARYSASLSDLASLAWPLWRVRDFRIDPNDPGKKERYQAEALVHRHLAVPALAGIVCHDTARQTEIARLVQESGHTLPVLVRPAFYF